jgi:acyl carrier protein
LENHSSIEAQVAAIFADVLGVASVPVDADFFELGGHSLWMMRLWNRIKLETGVDVSLSRILDNPTVRAITDVLQSTHDVVTARPELGPRS